MRVFVTGPTGHIGSAVVPELLAGSHEVVALARSEASAGLLTDLGAEVRRGDIDDLDGLRDAANSVDGAIHLAFKSDLMRSGPDGFSQAVAADMAAIQAIGETLVGTGKPFVSTSATLPLAAVARGRTATEADAAPGGPRIDAENYVVGLADRGVRSAVVRLTPITHSELDRQGFLRVLIAIARRSGVAAYLGEGANRWPSGHTRDAARVYRLALESAPAGSRLHPVGDEGVPIREIAEAIATNLGVPTRSLPTDQAEHFGFLTGFVGVDNPTSSERTQELLDWKPTEPGVIEDLNAGFYFAD